VAFSRKDLGTVLTLWPSIANPAGLRSRFAVSAYQVQYTLQTLAAPVVEGNQAHVTGRRSVVAVYEEGGKPDSVTANVLVTLTKTGDRWTIQDMVER
jgi:hypothetical protein